MIVGDHNQTLVVFKKLHHGPQGSKVVADMQSPRGLHARKKPFAHIPSSLNFSIKPRAVRESLLGSVMRIFTKKSPRLPRAEGTPLPLMVSVSPWVTPCGMSKTSLPSRVSIL